MIPLTSHDPLHITSLLSFPKSSYILLLTPTCAICTRTIDRVAMVILSLSLLIEYKEGWIKDMPAIVRMPSLCVFSHCTYAFSVCSAIVRMPSLCVQPLYVCLLCVSSHCTYAFSVCSAIVRMPSLCVQPLYVCLLCVFSHCTYAFCMYCFSNQVECLKKIWVSEAYHNQCAKVCVWCVCSVCVVCVCVVCVSQSLLKLHKCMPCSQDSNPLSFWQESPMLVRCLLSHCK